MNNRIEKLIKEALSNQPVECSPLRTDQWLKTFAELIVRDAMDYASRNWEHGHLLAEDLKVYFGVEE